MGTFVKRVILGQIFLLVDLRDFFSDLGSGDEKSSENDQLKTSKNNMKHRNKYYLESADRIFFFYFP